jgi:hypothetical protein
LPRFTSFLHKDGTRTKSTPPKPALPENSRFSQSRWADGTYAVAIKEYIQPSEAFFDETDIASGYDYSNVLEEAIREDSAGLIVVQETVCRPPLVPKEIRDFLRPVPETAECQAGGTPLFSSHRSWWV